MIDGIDDPTPKGRMIVQSHLMTQDESVMWLKYVAEFAPNDLFAQYTWVPDGPVN